VFGKKKPKKPQEPDYSKMPILPSKLAEYAQAQTGLTDDELIKLLESIGRINPEIVVTRHQTVKGRKASKKIGKMPIEDAVEYEKKRTEERHEIDRKIKEIIDVDLDELHERTELNDEIYPKRLAPTDIVRYTIAAKEQLEELDRERAKPRKVFSPREEAVLNVITLIKKYEAARVAQKIADRQRAAVLGKTMEELEAEHAAWLRKLKGEPEPETPEQTEERLKQEEETRWEEEKRVEETARTLEGFDKDIHTLVDEAGMLVGENPDAAAAVVKQWIGNIMTGE
jgi:hypothetical protein